MIGTFWAFVPAILAIVLALITKKVYLSLFAGIFLGAMFLANGNPLNAFGEMFKIMGDKVGGNIGILVFLIMLGILVMLMMRSGGSRAYGNWA
ncbi:MAG: Na+/H+ antiporter NhaC family protein, partial [Clostridia bacterium]